MDKKITHLSPVRIEDLEVTFGYRKNFDANTDPLKILSPTIESFPKLAIGKYFWVITNTVTWNLHSIQGMTYDLLGYHPEEIQHKDMRFIMSLTHPEDLQKQIAFTNHWYKYYTSLSAYSRQFVTANVQVRFVLPDKQIKWLLLQYLDGIINDNGQVMYALTLVTDISHLKKYGSPVFSILNSENESCQQFVVFEGQHQVEAIPMQFKLTNQELIVLRLLASGHSSKQIAAQLSNSVKTIDNHRQNMLHKTNSKSTAELVNFCITNGFI
jgi:DNA-binding CsgD family transcriptional regulator